VEATGMKEAFNVTLNETRILDIKFLHGCAKPTICMLYQDNRQIRHVKTAVIDVREKDITSAGPWSQSNVEFGANLIIPVPMPLGGILLVGSSSITYIGLNTATAGPPAGTGSGAAAGQVVIQSVEIAPTMITAYTCIAEDGSRFLLSDHRGALSVVVICTSAAGAVTSLAIDALGTTSIAENLAYLGDGLTFVGSIFGDSQLIKLQSERDAEGSNVQVLASHTNIGPIRDMCLVDNDKQGGQRQLVTCSGGYKDGSLRIIRSGIGMHEQASLEVPGIKALWSLRTDEHAAFDKYLVQSFVGETRVLAIENEEMGEVRCCSVRPVRAANLRVSRYCYAS
jgi:DNA damage-binding protein 1